MQRKRFFFVEPSKVGTQHITLIDGYLRALASSTLLRQSFELILCASRSTFDSLGATTRQGLRHEPIPVMNPEKRRLVIKTFVEFFVVLKYMLKMRPGDIVFISCVLPTTLLMLEVANRLLRRRGMFVMLHGEIEGLFDPSLQHFRSYGFWIVKWLRRRQLRSTLWLVVIDDFIKRKLLAEFPDKLADEHLFVVHHPVSAFSPGVPHQAEAPSVCFIGYRTKFKGFEQFRELSEALPALSFVAIGGGKIEELPSRRTSPLTGNDAYLRAVAACSVALFPYIAGYTCSLSAAALDALSSGVHIVATDRACFVGLAEYFGPDVVTICRSPEETRTLLDNPQWLAQQRERQPQRLAGLAASKYGLDAVRASFERLALTHAAPTQTTA